MNQNHSHADVASLEPLPKTEAKAKGSSWSPATCAQAIYETMPYGAICHDRNGQVVSANPAALLILGNTIERLNLLTWRDLERYCLREDGSRCSWHDLPPVVAQQTGVPQRNMVMRVYNRREGHHRLLNINAIPVATTNGEKPATLVYTLFDDITEGKERQQQEDHHTLLPSDSADGFWDWSQEKNEINFSQRWWHMLGYAEDEIARGPDLWQRMIHMDDRQRVGQLLGEALEGRTDCLELEYRLRHKLGHYVHVASRVYFFRDADGKARRVCGTTIDITERRQMEETLLLYQRELKLANETLELRVAERTEELESAIREQEAFSYSVSHDLRAPLRHINSFSAILTEEFAADLPPEAGAYLARIREASGRMGALIDDLLELSRLSRAELTLRAVNMSELALQILRMHQELDPHRRVEVTVAQGITALGDGTLLRQLLENLLANAWKYTSKKTRAQIVVGVLKQSEADVFFVRDDGVGFDMQYEKKLFAPFERLHGGEFQGNGIGLATAQRIVKRHGGRIWSEGKPGKGATFYFTLQSPASRYKATAYSNLRNQQQELFSKEPDFR